MKKLKTLIKAWFKAQDRYDDTVNFDMNGKQVTHNRYLLGAQTRRFRTMNKHAQSLGLDWNDTNKIIQDLYSKKQTGVA